MNKKKVIMTFLLLILILLLTFSQGFFNNSFKEVALMDNNIGELKEYTINTGQQKLYLPEDLMLVDGKVNEYITYQGVFKGENNFLSGYIEILNSDSDVKELAQKDMNNLSLEHGKEKIESYKDDNWKGMRVSYISKLSTGKRFVNNVYYINIDTNKIAKFTFLVDEEIYKDSMKYMFDIIVSKMESQNK